MSSPMFIPSLVRKYVVQIKYDADSLWKDYDSFQKLYDAEQTVYELMYQDSTIEGRILNRLTDQVIKSYSSKDR
jgi:hypothetical protein